MLSVQNFVRLSLALGLFATLWALHLTGLSISFNGMGLSLPMTIIVPLIGSFIYRSKGVVWIDRTVCGFECLSLLLLTSLIASVASYPLAAISTGWMDKDILWIDAALGFDWPSYWNFIQKHYALNLMLAYGYNSFFLTPPLLIAILIILGRSDDAYRFLASFVIALAFTDIISTFVPAKSAAAHFLSSNAPNLPLPGLLHIPIIEGLRSGSFTSIPIARLDGLIAFPSFHAAAAVMCAWAGRRVEWVRFPCLFLNVLMVLSTPIQGGHYFSETIGGLAVAAVAIALARMLPQAKSRSQTHMSRTRAKFLLASRSNAPTRQVFKMKLRKAVSKQTQLSSLR
jgi:membrane-associated phospholipid phosphatase